MATSELPAVRDRGPRTELSLAAPHRVTAVYALAAVGALVVLGVVSAWWVTALVATVLGLLGGGTLLPVVVVVATGTLLGRGWMALGSSVRARLRPADLSDVAALPDAVHRLSPGLQRLVRHGRTVAATLAEPELTHAQALRELYDWVTMVATLGEADAETLADRRLHPESLRSRIVGLEDGPDARRRGIEMVEGFERVLLHAEGDPFRR